MQVEGGTLGGQTDGGTVAANQRVDVVGNAGNVGSTNPSGGIPGGTNPSVGVSPGGNPSGGIPGGTNPSVGVSPGGNPPVDDRIFGVSADVVTLISLFIAVVALILSLRAWFGRTGLEARVSQLERDAESLSSVARQRPPSEGNTPGF